MKKIFLFLIVGMFLINFTSATDFDNVLSYSNDDLNVQIKNWFGLTNIGEVDLISHKSIDEIRVVPVGNDVAVMGYKFRNFENVYKNGLGNVKFIDVETGKEINKNYYFAEAIYNGKEVTYVPFNSNDIPNKEMEIWLMTSVNSFETIDGIWTIAGKEITKHAIWSSSLNEDIISYWKLDATTGNVVDSVGSTNGTNMGAVRGITGVVGNSFVFNGTSDWVNLTTSDTDFNVTTFTISAWVKWNATKTDTQEQWFVQNRKVGQANGDRPFSFGNTGGVNGQLGFFITNTSGSEGSIGLLGIGNYSVGQWYHVVATRNSTGAAIYVDGVYNKSSSTVSGHLKNLGQGELKFGYPYLNGSLDEIGFWKRELTSSEISELYNSGSGITYAPLITLSAPSNHLNTSLNSYGFEADYDFGDFTLTNTTLYLQNGSGNLRTNYSTVTGSINSTNLTLSDIDIGTYNYTYYTCGANGADHDCVWALLNYTFSRNAFEENSQSYNASVYETSEENFVINLRYDGSEFSSISANLIYNGSYYLGSKQGTGNTINFTRTLQIPVINTFSTTNDFWWEIIATSGDGTYYHNSSSNTQTVNKIIFANCNATYSKPVFVNFTIYNESSRLSDNSSFDATFVYSLGGDLSSNYSFASSVDNSTFKFCTNYNATFEVDSIIEIDSPEFNPRIYYFRGEEYSNNSVKEQYLYLTDHLSSDIIIQVQDSGLQPLEDYLIEVERYYPGTGEYELVESMKTDIYGQAVANLVQDDVKYQFKFKDSTNSVIKTTGDMTVACRTTICVLPFVIEDTTDYMEKFDNVTDYDWSFTFNNATNIYTFTWNDLSGVSATNWLKVERYLWNGTTLVCNTTSTSSSGSLTCNVGNVEANYQAQVFRKVSGENWNRIAFLSNSVGSTFAIYGKEALVWSFILLMTALAVGYWFPPVGVVLYAAISLMLYMSKIVFLNPTILISEFLVCILFCWLFGGRR